MNKNTNDRKRRALRAKLLQTYMKLRETNDVHKKADFRLKSLRLQEMLREVEGVEDRREYVTDKFIAGHCMNCERPVATYSALKVESNGSMFCCEGCRVHYDELCGHKKAAASRERNRLSNLFEKTHNVILSNKEPQGKLG